jgi:hypothetical protein
MGHQNHFRGTGPGQDLLYEVVQADRCLLDIEPVSGDRLASPGNQLLDEILVRRRLEGGRGLVVEPVDPQRSRVQLLRLRIRVVEDLFLVAADVDPVLLVPHQPDQGALELIESWITVTGHADMRGAVIEAIERVVDLSIYPGGRPGVAANVYDWQFFHFPSPKR